MSGGAKAGLAIGILLIVAILGALVFFFYRRRQRQDSEGAYEKTDDEKNAYAAGLARAQSSASTRTAATAPRLSLRPVTQFLPDLAARGKAANAVATAGLHDSSMASVAAMARTQNEFYPGMNEKSNPFGDHAQAAQANNRISDPSSGLPIQSNSTEDPFGNHAAAPAPVNSSAPADIPAPLRLRTPTPEGIIAAAGVAAAAGGAAIAGAKAVENKDTPKPLNPSSNRSASPTPSSSGGSEFSQTPASPTALGPNGAGPSNVYRIQLDFKPSMEDELGLRAGDLVRLLHEYDDGWVSLFFIFLRRQFANPCLRRSVFVSIALNKGSLHVPVFQPALSNLVLAVLLALKVPVAHHHHLL